MTQQGTPNASAALSGKQRRHLRALAHHLDPVVQVGHAGLTEGVMKQIDDALRIHELVKVKLGKESPALPEEVASAVSEQLSAAIAQTLGKTLVVYRPHPKDPKIVLPR